MPTRWILIPPFPDFELWRSSQPQSTVHEAVIYPAARLSPVYSEILFRRPGRLGCDTVRCLISPSKGWVRAASNESLPAVSHSTVSICTIIVHALLAMSIERLHVFAMREHD
jgi:hypothetical protein